MNQEFIKRLFSSIVLIPIALYFVIKGSNFFVFFLCTIFVISVFEWLKLSQKFILAKVLGTFFLFFSFCLAYLLREKFGLNVFLFIILISIFTDIGGYFFGKIFKGPKISKISPNKTYSGVIGSFIISSVGGFVFLENISISLVSIGLLGSYDANVIFLKVYTLLIILIISFISQIGDLTVSYFKRVAKVKDTGKILPGHGGLLDRIDGIIFAVPFSYLILNFNIY